LTQKGGTTEKVEKLMKSAIGICSSVVVKRTNGKCYMYMRFGDEKQAQPMESAIDICRYVVKRRGN
jgi:hypothetical protein